MKRSMTLLGAAATLALLSTTAAADSGGYVGGAAGFASYNYSDVEDSTAFSIYGGYRPRDGGLGLEVGFLDLGDADITSISGMSLNISGFNVSATYGTVPNVASPLTIFGKLGLYSFDTELAGAGMSASSSGLSFGVGLEYTITERLALRAELQNFSGVEDFANDEDVSLISAGVSYAF